MTSGTARAAWHAHVNHVNPPAALRHWLTDTMSLTLKLTLRSAHFRVRRLCQESAPSLGDEYGMVGLARPLQVQQREVQLECDGRPVVFAHTIVPLHASAHDWPFFGTLGERSLGSTLFGDPRVVRGRMQYARLQERHPLAQRARHALGELAPASGVLYARRCLYRRRNGLLLVTEVFLPAVLALPQPRRAQPMERHTVR